MDKIARQQALLQAIVQEYVKTARPVGSKTLAREYGFDFSPATIRNDMAALEEEGLIVQPHTSAGRIPTEKGYRYYIHHFLQERSLAAQKKKRLQQTVQEQVRQKREADMRALKEVAHVIAGLTNETVVITLDSGETVTSGMSHMFRKPEFTESEMMVEIGEAFDHIDEMMHTMHNALTQEVEVFLGSQNPFAGECSVILSEYTFGGDRQGVMGILGPMRMDYDTNIALMHYMEELMHDDHEQ